MPKDRVILVNGQTFLFRPKLATPFQEIVKTTTHQHTLGFSSTQREVVTSSAGGVGGGKGEGRGRSGNRAKIVDRRAKIGFHNGHTLVLPHEVRVLCLWREYWPG